MDNSIRFGTDGWRGIIAEDFTFDNVRICAQGVADYLKEAGAGARGAVIGYDNRFESEDFVAAAARVLSANGIKVYLCSRSAPTPVISYGAVIKKASGAIAITASHNPPAWNGFKYKTGDGASAPPEVASRIEENIGRVVASRRVERTLLTVSALFWRIGPGCRSDFPAPNHCCASMPRPAAPTGWNPCWNRGGSWPGYSGGDYHISPRRCVCVGFDSTRFIWYIYYGTNDSISCTDHL